MLLDSIELQTTINKSVDSIRFERDSETAAGAISDLTAIVNAAKTGKVGLQVASGLKLLNTLDRNKVIPYLGTANTVAQGAVSIYNLHTAFSAEGTDLQRVSATLNAVNYLNTATSFTIPAISNVLNGAAGGIAQSGLGGIGALPALGLIISIKNEDPVGIAMSLGTLIQGSAFLTTNPLGWALLAISLYKAVSSDTPEGWGIGSFEFGQSSALALTVDGKGIGKPRVEAVMGQLKDYLDATIAQQQQANPAVLLGIIPQRLGNLTWREARQGDPGFAFRDADPVSNAAPLDFIRYNDDLQPNNADPADAAQRRELRQRMVDSAINHRAIAPLWEVNTARLQQDLGDPNAGLTEEARAVRRGLLAPADPATNRATPGAFRPIALDLDGDGRFATVGSGRRRRMALLDGQYSRGAFMRRPVASILPASACAC